jgi:hypothetical protein
MTPVARRREARRRWLLRATAGAVVALALVYAALPLWLPTELLRRRLEADLTRQLGNPVHIGQLRAGWLEGISLDNLTIPDDRPGRTGNVVQVGSIRCELAPLKLLAGRRISELSIYDPQVWLEIDDAGQVTVGDLNPARGNPLPSLNYAVYGVTCHVATSTVSQRFRLDRLDLQLDPPNGILHLASVTRVDRAGDHRRGQLEFDANLRIPRLKRTEQLNGEIRVEWTNLALNDLPVPIISRVPVEQVDGTSSGRLAFKTHPDLGVDYSFSVRLNRVRIMRPELHRPAQVPDADLACDGHWDLTENTFLMTRFSYETPGLRVQAAGADRPALRYDQHGETLLETHLKGQVKDWRELRREIPEVDHAIRMAGGEPTGKADFSADLSRIRSETRVRIDVDASRTAYALDRDDKPLLRADAGVTKKIHAELIDDSQGQRVVVPGLSISLGDLGIEATGEATMGAASKKAGHIGAERFLSILPTIRAELTARCKDTAGLKRLLPCLNQYRELQHLAGPVEVRAGLEPEGPCGRAHLAVSLPKESSLAWGDIVDKQPGMPLRAEVAAGLPYADTGRFSLITAALQYGSSRAELTTGKTGFTYHLGFEPAAKSGRVELRTADASWAYDVRITAIQELLSLSPRIERLKAENRITQTFGDCDLDCRSSVSYRPGDVIVHNEIRLLADPLAVQWGTNLNKTAGVPLKIELQHGWRAAGSSSEHQLAVMLRRPCGTVEGSVIVGSPDAADAARPLHVLGKVDITDLDEWLSISPRAIYTLSPHQTAGELSMSLQMASLDGNWQSGQLAVDATRADLGSGIEQGWRKPAGLPAIAELAWSGGTLDDLATGTVFRIRGHARLGEATIDQIKGEAMLNLGSVDRLDLAGLADRLRANSTQAWLELGGKVVVTDELTAVHPRFRKWIDDTQIAGSAKWRLYSRIDPATVSLDGQIDASDATFTFDLNDGVFRTVRKDAGDHLAATWTVSVADWLNAAQRTLVVERATLDLLGNSLSADGRLRLNSLPGPTTETQADESMKLSLRVPDASRLLKLLAKPPVAMAAGGLSADAVLHHSGDLRIRSGRVAFDELRIGSTQRPFRLQGALDLQEDRLRVDELNWGWGQSSGRFSVTAAPLEQGYAVQMGLVGDRIVVEDLSSCLDELRAGFAPARNNTVTAPPSEPAASRARAILELLRHSQARIDARAGTVVTPLPLNIKAVLDAGWHQLTLDKGDVKMQFGCLVDGGQANGDVHMDLNAAEPTYRLTYMADRIQAGDLTRAYLRRTFPGMEASGALTLIDESNAKLLPAAGDANWETGKGQIIIDGGVISGRSAPLWVTRFFPRLNLSSFEFTRMHSWFDKTASGRVHHQMIYRGTYYHVYMIGWSEKNGTFRYEVGLDFLAGLESEYWANSGQGRVPLFTKTGQVQPDGSIVDETVTFVPLTRVVETLFVHNNPLVTAYHGVHKRVMKQK